MQTLDLTQVKVVAEMVVKRCVSEQQIDINGPVNVILPEKEFRLLDYAFRNFKEIVNITNLDKVVYKAPYAFKNCTIINKKPELQVEKEPIEVAEIESNNTGICIKDTLYIYNGDLKVSKLVKSKDFIWTFKNNKLEYIDGKFTLIYNNKEYIIENCKLTDEELKFDYYIIK